MDWMKLAGQAGSGMVAGGKAVGGLTVKAIKNIHEQAKEDMRKRKETEQIRAACEEVLSSARSRQSAAEARLRAEQEDFAAEVGETERRLLYTYGRFCEYLRETSTLVAPAGERTARPQDVGELRLWRPERGLAAGALAGGLGAGASAVGLVTAFGTAGTGTAIATLSGPAYVNATLAALGGGSLATGGMGMAGGLAVLGATVAAPVAAAVAWAADRKVKRDYESVRRYQAETEEYAAAVGRYEGAAGVIRSRTRALAKEVYAFSLFFHEVLNMGAGLAASGERGFVAVMNDAATTLIALCRLAPAGEDGLPREAFDTELQALRKVAGECRAELFSYYVSLSARARAAAEAARERDLTLHAENIVQELAAIRAAVKRTEEKVEAVGKSVAMLVSSLKGMREELKAELKAQAGSLSAQEQTLSSFAARVSEDLANARDIFSDGERRREETELRRAFGEGWERLEPSSRRFILTARLLYGYMEAEGGDSDYSGVCILMSKAVENELKKRFFTGFGTFLEERYPFPRCAALWPTTLAPRVNGRQYRRLREDSFTLGSVAYACTTLSSGGLSAEERHRDVARVTEYAAACLFKGESPETAFKGVAKCAALAETVRRDYRNAAAHTQAMGMAKAQECLAYLLDPKGDFIMLMKFFAF